MKVSMQMTGADDLAKRLDQLPLAMTKDVLRSALKVAAQPIQQRAHSLAPRGRQAKFGHLADFIVVSTVTRIGSVQGGRWQSTNEPWVAVGPRKDFFYGLFQEYGTKRHGAQPFMRPAFDAGAPAAIPILSRELWAALRKKLPESFSVDRGYSQSVAA